MRFKQFKFLFFKIITRYFFKDEMLKFIKLYKNTLFGKYSYYNRIENFTIDKNTLYIDTDCKINKVVFTNEGELRL